MFRRAVGAVAVLSICLGIAMAEEIRGIITKVDGDKVTVKTKDGEKVLTAAKDVKVVKGKFNKDTKKVEAGDAVDGGLKTIAEKAKADDKGVGATVITEGDKITEIRLAGGGKKKQN